MHRHVALLLASLPLAALSACGSAEPAASEQPDTAETTEASAPKPSRCQAVPAAQIASRAEGATYTLTDGFAVKSKDFSNVFMLGASFVGGGLDGDKPSANAQNGSEGQSAAKECGAFVVFGVSRRRRVAAAA